MGGWESCGSRVGGFGHIAGWGHVCVCERVACGRRQFVREGGVVCVVGGRFQRPIYTFFLSTLFI